MHQQSLQQGGLKLKLPALGMLAATQGGDFSARDCNSFQRNTIHWLCTRVWCGEGSLWTPPILYAKLLIASG